MNQDSGMDALGGIAIVVFLLFFFAILALMLAGMWKTFEKAGRPGWSAIIPIYNVVIMLEIVGKPTWWIVFFFIPIASIVVAIMIAVEMAKCFGKGGGFGVGLALMGPIFYPILGFGDARYLGPQAVQPPPLRPM